MSTLASGRTAIERRRAAGQGDDGTEAAEAGAEAEAEAAAGAVFGVLGVETTEEGAARGGCRREEGSGEFGLMASWAEYGYSSGSVPA